MHIYEVLGAFTERGMYQQLANWFDKSHNNFHSKTKHKSCKIEEQVASMYEHQQTKRLNPVASVCYIQAISMIHYTEELPSSSIRIRIRIHTSTPSRISYDPSHIRPRIVYLFL